MAVTATVAILPGAAVNKSTLMRPTPKAGAAGLLGPHAPQARLT